MASRVWTRVGIDLQKEETWADFKNALLAGITITKSETCCLRSLVDLVKALSKDASENPQVCSHLRIFVKGYKWAFLILMNQTAGLHVNKHFPSRKLAQERIAKIRKDSEHTWYHSTTWSVSDTLHPSWSQSAWGWRWARTSLTVWPKCCFLPA